MAVTQKILGQAALALTTLTNVYAVPAATTATISTISVCNRAATACTFRIGVAIAGAADTVAQYLFYDAYLDANSTYIATIGITVGAADVIRVYSSNASTSVNIFGIEVA